MELKEKRTKWLTTRVTQEEYNEIFSNFSSTTERKIGTYVRKILLKKPIIGSVRNLSQEAQIQEFVALTKILNGIANNFNQMVHRLHLIKNAPQIQELILKQELDKRKLMGDVGEIKMEIKRLVSQWLQ